MLQQERKMDGTNMHRGPNISVEHGGLWGIQSASGVKKKVLVLEEMFSASIGRIVRRIKKKQLVPIPIL